MQKTKKFNFIMLFAGTLMIAASILNYQMNKDEVSMGIFVFAGIGFLFTGIKDRYEDQRKRRMQRLSMSFYFIAVLIFIYWIAVSQFGFFK